MSKHPARKAEPGTEVSWTGNDGSSRLLRADTDGRVVIHDDEDDAMADASGFTVIELPAAPAKLLPAAPAKEGA